MSKLRSLFPAIITKRLDGIGFEEYKERLRDQKAMIKYYLRNGRAKTIEAMKKIINR